jgi:hypothetical protein
MLESGRVLKKEMNESVMIKRKLIVYIRSFRYELQLIVKILDLIVIFKKNIPFNL